jgi:hypothetical protein
MKILITILTICVVSVSTQTSIDNSSTAEKTIQVKDFTFVYKVDGPNLVASVSCPTSGWVAVGFNPSKIMKDANLIMGYADPEGPVIVDQFGSDTYKHQPDTSIGGRNDIIDANCVEENGMTTLSFTIPLSSGDSKDVVLQKNSKTKVIFAAGKEKDLKKKHYKTARTEIILEDRN